MRRLLYGAVATWLVLAAGVYSCVAVRSRDLPDPGDADLLSRRVEGSEEDGYPALKRAADELSYQEDEELFRRVRRTLRGEERLDEQLSAIIDANRAVLDEIRNALAARRLRIPERESDRPESYRYVRYVVLARLLALEAHRHALRGRTQRSIAVHLEAIELGYRLETAEGSTLIDVILAMSVKNIASESLRGSLARIELTADDARRTARALATYRSSPEGWSRMWAEEYRKAKEMMLRAQAAPSGPGVSLNPMSWLPASYTFQLNRTLDSYAGLYRTRQKLSSLPCSRIPSDPPLPSPWEQVRTVLDHNGVGNVLLGLTAPNLRSFDERRCLVDTSLAATQALLGLRAYQREHGDLPDALTALVPRYLESLPQDGFDDTPLRYSRSSRWLHSPGSDQLDQGGEREDREGKEFMREPTYRIPF